MQFKATNIKWDTDGDTEADVVATVYGLALAETIVAEHNSLKSD